MPVSSSRWRGGDQRAGVGALAGQTPQPIRPAITRTATAATEIHIVRLRRRSAASLLANDLGGALAARDVLMSCLSSHLSTDNRVRGQTSRNAARTRKPMSRTISGRVTGTLTRGQLAPRAEAAAVDGQPARPGRRDAGDEDQQQRRRDAGHHAGGQADQQQHAERELDERQGGPDDLGHFEGHHLVRVDRAPRAGEVADLRGAGEQPDGGQAEPHQRCPAMGVRPARSRRCVNVVTLISRPVSCKGSKAQLVHSFLAGGLSRRQRRRPPRRVRPGRARPASGSCRPAPPRPRPPRRTTGRAAG